MVNFKGLPSHPAVKAGDYSKEFLWVRWLVQDVDYQSGWKAKCLHRISFFNSTEDGAFGFLDPKHVICSVHLIPAFAFGQTDHYLSPSIARLPSENDKDWVFYYVAM
jgi:hypothetical protein